MRYFNHRVHSGHMSLKWATSASFFEVRYFFRNAYFGRMLLRISVVVNQVGKARRHNRRKDRTGHYKRYQELDHIQFDNILSIDLVSKRGALLRIPVGVEIINFDKWGWARNQREVTFGEVEKEEIESVPKKFLEVLKLRAEQVFIKEESGGSP